MCPAVASIKRILTLYEDPIDRVVVAYVLKLCQPLISSLLDRFSGFLNWAINIKVIGIIFIGRTPLYVSCNLIEIKVIHFVSERECQFILIKKELFPLSEFRAVFVNDSGFQALFNT